MCTSVFSTFNRRLLCRIPTLETTKMAEFQLKLQSAKNIVFLTGAGISAESGIPTFRGASGMWRKYDAASLATPEAFGTNPSLVWEFYHYRREVADKAEPNKGHKAITIFEKFLSANKKMTLITQNVDRLHTKAGTENILELHGNLFKTRCTKCNEVKENFDSPICEALRDRGAPDVDQVGSDIPVKDLPHCQKSSCRGLLRPHVVWFGEKLDEAIIDKAEAAMGVCDVCLLVGTSSIVHPAARFALQAKKLGTTMAEINLVPTPLTDKCHYHFEGQCGTLLPELLSVEV